MLQVPVPATLIAMQRLSGAQTGAGSDGDRDFKNEDPYSDSHEEEWVVQVPAAVGGGQGLVGHMCQDILCYC
jgi:hypothetical protein